MVIESMDRASKYGARLQTQKNIFFFEQVDVEMNI